MIDAAFSRIQRGLSDEWRPELSYSSDAGWRCHIVKREDPAQCVKTTHGGDSFIVALMKMEQFVGSQSQR